MRVISTEVLKNFAKKNPTAIPAAEFLIPLFERATWKNLIETRQYLSHADEVVVKSGKTITVFNLGGNNWRVITAIHYNRQMMFIFAVLTHAEYSRGKWKEKL